MTITSGQYQGKAVKGSVQYGETPNGTLQIAINMELFDDKDQSIGTMTTFLYFSDAAAVYSYERLRALGWKGEGPDQIDRLDDIFDEKVPVRVTAPEPYKTADGTEKMGSPKLEILTGGGTVTINNPVEKNTFKARLKSLGGTAGGSSASTSSTSGNGGGPAPPF